MIFLVGHFQQIFWSMVTWQETVFSSAYEIIGMQNLDYDGIILAIWKKFPDTFFEDSEIRRRIRIEASYAMAIDRQQAEVELLRRESQLKIPHDFNFREWVQYFFIVHT